MESLWPRNQNNATPVTSNTLSTSHGSSFPKLVQLQRPSYTNQNHHNHSNAHAQPSVHMLKYSFTFWYMNRTFGSKIKDYESSLKKLMTFSSVEEFWSIYAYLKRPDTLPVISDFHLFKEGIKPIFEDSANQNGGKWTIRLRKGVAVRYWEQLVMAIVGDQFWNIGDELCGAVLSIRNSEDLISVWNKSSDNGRVNLKIRDFIKQVLNLPPDTILEYRGHKDSLIDTYNHHTSDKSPHPYEKNKYN
ncbi:uncharacterized protein T551_00474 [Pneumocystis jirovecii RU7]|uniref:Eukaryotic translation initiation factor 4E type 2 n=1 Tax=Pneumocystis jirovecii (strain RU7) TaxID=1408657 RepID=A0A0W4ZVI6_PNEJ7|nr:uncharacterized protein T551_00474 [Pneumocystis jirovecii RU7]KTW32384.1 hypothetical protein T551_00474 [Pneumocystis jirovecii RU7]